MAVVVIGIWAWTQRYDLMERRAVQVLSEAGFEAELDIVSISSTQAQIRDIHLRRENKDVVRIKTLRAEYVWPDVREGRLIGLDLDGVAGRLELGEDWKPTDAWVQDLIEGGAGGGNSGDPVTGISETGIRLNESTFTLVSPLGEQTFDVNANVETSDRFKAELKLPLSDISYRGVSAKGSGLVTIEQAGGEYISFQGQTQTEVLSNSKFQIEDASLDWDGKLNLEANAYSGVIAVDGQDISGDVLTAEAARISWDGKADFDDKTYGGILIVDGQRFSSDLIAADAAQITWDGDFTNLSDTVAQGRLSISAARARTPRAARADELSETLSLFPALSVVPVAEHFAPDLKQSVQAFFLGADVAAEGDLNYGPDGFTLTPLGAMRVETPENRLRLIPRADQDFFTFNRAEESILAQMDAAFDLPVGLTLTEIELRAKSENGVSLGGVDSFSTKLETSQNWITADEDNRLVRLGPLAASMRYVGGVNPRRLAIDTRLDFDGSLPGGRVEGLNLEGRLDVRLFEGKQVLDFTPIEDSRIRLKSMETPTAWFGEDMSFNLPPTVNLFTRTAEQSTLIATLQMADFTLTQPATDISDAQRLDIESAALDLKGRLFPDKTQDWTIGFQDVNYASETLPGPGTMARAAQANLTARLVPDQSAQITLNSPSITAETPLARLSDFEIALTGTPEAYSVEHKGGSVDVVGDDFVDAAAVAGLSSFPANGRVEFKDGRFVGKSNLVVAKANDAAVNVAYEFANGVGRAEIDIPSILFEPQGLQPQTLVPAFRGKIARVEGEARAKVNIAFADGALTESSGTVQLVDTALGTAPGPMSGLNAIMQFDSLWPLETSGIQTLTLESFNPGMALDNGTISYNLVPNGVEVFSADWPIGNGSFSLDPFTWNYGAAENRVTMRVKNVALGDFLNDVGNRKIQATGNVVGAFPIVVRGIEVLIEQGTLSVPDGGVITYDPGPNVRAYSEEEAIEVLRQRRSSEYAAIAQDALRKFRYKELSATIDGPLEGDVEIGMIFDGSNEKVLNRQPFRFDISVKGELFNIARSFNSNAQVKSEILRQNGQLPEGTIIGE